MRALVQVARAAVVAEPRPGGEHVVERRRGERLHRRPARQEALVEGDDGLDRRLLQHDLATARRGRDRRACPARARHGRSRRSRSYQCEQRVDRVGPGEPELQLLSRHSSHGLASSRPPRESIYPMVSVDATRWKLARARTNALWRRNAATFRRPAPRPREAVGFARKRAGFALGVKAVGSFVPKLTRKAFEKYGFSAAS